MRPRTAALAPLALLALTGCTGGGGAPASAPTAQGKAPAASAAPGPRTPEEYLARAKAVLAEEQGWTFAVRGSEALTSPGGSSSASYEATVDRSQLPPALHSSGTTHAKGADKPEEVYVVDGTVYVKKGGRDARWKSGPPTDPEMANAVEDPAAALEGYAEGASGPLSVTRTGAGVELRAAAGPAALSAVRDRPLVRKAVRELAPALEQLRAAGIAAPDSRIRLESAEEVLTLDPATYRLTAHRFRCVFRIPYGGQEMRYSQEVTSETTGVFMGTIALPPGARR
ncbi:hypothetical protein [Streptomyces griseosporeus]|uniref:hypothetical protein n=1 Tax=Streptomyces griseosporeus TaxID=1910 RepID=UPI00167E090B|nr:hypothetical protein [Streptomyces griseosporeus]GHF61912.1 hypothetical protein GCM10018783_33810 [Streptomyces griseosporeus]